jgi:hypothetical protein
MGLNLATGDLNLHDNFINVYYSPTDNFLCGGEREVKKKEKIQIIILEIT